MRICIYKHRMNIYSVYDVNLGTHNFMYCEPRYTNDLLIIINIVPKGL